MFALFDWRATTNGISAAAATFAKIWFMAGHMTNLDDVTYAWAPLSLCYV